MSWIAGCIRRSVTKQLKQLQIACPCLYTEHQVFSLFTVVKGSSLSQDLSYTPTQEDEVEDLYQLLTLVKEKHPDLQGVASGAILSNYQRNRVESV